ncbi:MAG: undecaprenyl-diphosphate phosphatase [Clostridiaceae bacterium]|jgi:undecaprenyl pyrophosphate phosphatase UppP|nr:undecaprenyl-diphosphate phosphatase [Clostridiaceae bacterium]
METIKAIILGIIQGLTEFLPVSSSGHLVLAESIGLGGVSLFFNVMLHAGTLLAVLIVFRKEIARMARHPLKSEFPYLIIAMLPTGAIAILLKLFLPDALNGAYLPFGFIATAAVLVIGEGIGKRGLSAGADKRKRDFIPTDRKTRFADGKRTFAEAATNKKTLFTERRRTSSEAAAEFSAIAYERNGAGDGASSNAAETRTEYRPTPITELTSRPNNGLTNALSASGTHAANSQETTSIGEAISTRKNKKHTAHGLTIAAGLLAGIFQGIAVLPGLSRSGSTTAALLIGGVNREQALSFSFLLSIPVILLSVGYEAATTPINTIGIGIPALISGVTAAFFSGLFAVKFMMRVFREKSLLGFAAYTFLLGAGLLIAKAFV